MSVGQQLDGLLDDLKIQESYIKGTAKFILQYPLESVNNIQKLMDHMQNNNEKQKIVYIYVIHEILLQNNDIFIKTIGQNLKNIIQIISDSINNVAQQQNIIKLINVWKDLQIYHPSFIEKLNQIIYVQIQNIQKKNKQQINEDKNQSQQNKVKFSQAQIRDYKLVQSNELTKTSYDQLVKEQQLQKKLNIYNAGFHNQTQQDIQQTQELGEECINEYKQLLEQQNNNYQDCLQQLEKLKTEYEQFSYKQYEDILRQVEAENS